MLPGDTELSNGRRVSLHPNCDLRRSETIWNDLRPAQRGTIYRETCNLYHLISKKHKLATLGCSVLLVPENWDNRPWNGRASGQVSHMMRYPMDLLHITPLGEIFKILKKQFRKNWVKKLIFYSLSFWSALAWATLSFGIRLKAQLCCDFAKIFSESSNLEGPKLEPLVWIAKLR